MQIVNSPILSDKEKQHIIHQNERGLSYEDNDLDLSMISNVDYNENFPDNINAKHFKFDNKKELDHANSVKFLQGKNGKKILSKKQKVQCEINNIYEYVFQKTLGANINKKYGYLDGNTNYKYIDSLKNSQVFIQKDQQFIEQAKNRKQPALISNIDNFIDAISQVFSHNKLYDIKPNITLGTNSRTGNICNIQITYCLPYSDKKTNARKYKTYCYKYHLSEQLMQELSQPTPTRDVFLTFLFNYYYDNMMFDLFDRKLDNMAIERKTGNINHFDIDSLEYAACFKDKKRQRLALHRMNFLQHIVKTFRLTEEEEKKYTQLVQNKLNKTIQKIRQLSEYHHNPNENNILIKNLCRELYKADLLEHLDLKEFFSYITARIEYIQAVSGKIASLSSDTTVHQQVQQLIWQAKQHIDQIRDKYIYLDNRDIIQQQAIELQQAYDQAQFVSVIINDPIEGTSALETDMQRIIKEASALSIVSIKNLTWKQQQYLRNLEQTKRIFLNLVQSTSAKTVFDTLQQLESLKSAKNQLIKQRNNNILPSTISENNDIHANSNNIAQQIKQIEQQIEDNQTMAKKHITNLVKDYLQMNDYYQTMLNCKKAIEKLEKQKMFAKKNQKNLSLPVIRSRNRPPINRQAQFELSSQSIFVPIT